MSRIHAQDHRLEALGYVVEVQDVGRLLTNSLQATHLHWFTPSQIETLQQHQDRVELSLSTGENLHTRLLVAADGAQSSTRQLLGIGIRQQPYHQNAVIANIRTDSPHHGWAFERFTDTGPLALLPMTENRYSLVWSVLPEQAESIVAQTPTAFLTALQRRFGHRAGNFIEVGQRHVYPLALVQAEALTSHRAVVLGNAAHSLHPIAGQGFNLGLRDIWQLVEQIKRKGEIDPGDFAVLHAFGKAQKQDHQRVIGMTDTLCRVFSNQHFPLVAGRNLGLLCTQLMPSLNDWVARQGMGKIVAL
jgi:2-octaprenyl-6-methoxyphenol hydroxylase